MCDNLTSEELAKIARLLGITSNRYDDSGCIDRFGGDEATFTAITNPRERDQVFRKFAACSRASTKKCKSKKVKKIKDCDFDAACPSGAPKKLRCRSKVRCYKSKALRKTKRAIGCKRVVKPCKTRKSRKSRKTRKTRKSTK